MRQNKRYLIPTRIMTEKKSFAFSNFIINVTFLFSKKFQKPYNFKVYTKHTHTHRRKEMEPDLTNNTAHVTVITKKKYGLITPQAWFSSFPYIKS